MCGITGYTFFSRTSTENAIEKMVDSLGRRGPDSNKYITLKKFNNTYALGHTRLAIIDISNSGDQPMENKKYIIVLNGEIYNYKTLKKELEKKGITFISASDTEVVLEAITFYGIDKALELFRGMYAFALYNKENGEITICRDKVGVKPLYYYVKDDILLFGSELKSIMAFPKFKKEIDKESLYQFLKYGYINAPKSIFKNTYKILPGQYIVFDNNGKATKNTFWSLEKTYKNEEVKKEENLKKGLDHNLNKLNDVLCNSFDLRMVSDVPIGVFLSGGIDSSLLVALLKNELNHKLDTFTIGFDVKEYDESKWAQIASNTLKTNHHELICTEKDALELIQQLPKVYDEPFGDSSAIPTMLVSKFARKKVKVALSADGGDELFFGYNRYQGLDEINKSKTKKLVAKTLNILPNSTPETIYKILNKFKTINGFQDKITKFKNVLSTNDLSKMYDAYVSYYTDDELSILLNTDVISNGNLKSYNNIEDLVFTTDFTNYLPGDILAKVDRASMAFSLEARDPFLDPKIIEFAAATPLEFKYKDGEKKYILKKLLERHLPKSYIYREKKGFGIPIDKWFNGELKPLVKHYLSQEMLNKHNLFNSNYVQTLMNNYYNNKGVNSHKIWFLLMFQMWYEQWIENK